MYGVEWNSKMLDELWKEINKYVLSIYTKKTGAIFVIPTADILSVFDVFSKKNRGDE